MQDTTLVIHTRTIFNNGEILMQDLLNNMSSTKLIFNEDGKEINRKTITNSFGSYLFIW